MSGKHLVCLNYINEILKKVKKCSLFFVIGVCRSSSRFSLDDLDKMVETKAIVKKEAASPSIAKPDLPAPVRVSSRKRKGSEVSSPATFTDLDFNETQEMLYQVSFGILYPLAVCCIFR